MRFIARHCRDYLIAVGMRITLVAELPNKFLIAGMLRCVRGVALGLATLLSLGVGSALATSPPTLVKSFALQSVPLTGATTLTFTITNPNIFLVLTGVAFTDVFPDGLVIANPEDLTNSCGAIVTAVAGTNTVTVSNGVLAPGGSCAVSLIVTTTSAGEKVNITSQISSNEGGLGTASLAVLNVIAPPVVSTLFGVSSIQRNDTTVVEFVFDNPNPYPVSLTGIALEDVLPAGLVVANPANIYNGICNTDDTIAAVPGTNLISISNVSLPGGSDCGVFVDVTATTVGLKNNVTSAIASNEGGNGAPATASLLVRTPHDFNADGMTDLLWRDTSGNLAMWLMSGAEFTASFVGNVPTSWSVLGTGDFNLDFKADILWRDTSGNVAIWLMNGGTISSSAFLGNVPTSWSVAGTGDFNGDGKVDILWRDTSGNVAIWLMNGGTILSSVLVGNVPTSWSVVGTGDFNGRGGTDILWRDTSGNVAIWLMNGATIASSVLVGNIPTSWSVVGTGDFDGNGKADILWRDFVGNVAIWLMEGTQVASSTLVANVPTSWSIVHTGDFDGNGKSDILWHDISGNTAIWFMNGAAVQAGASLGNVPTAWTIQGANAD